MIKWEDYMKQAARILILALFAIVAASPVIFLLAGTFTGSSEITGNISAVLAKEDGYARWNFIPQYPTMQNIVELLLDAPEFFQMFWNSIKIVLFTIAGQLLFGMAAAWGMACYNFRGKKYIYMLYIIMMMMPFQVTMLSEYLVLDKLKLLDTSAAVILPGIFSTFPVFIMYRFFCGIPESIIEAAKIDGASEIQIFLRIGIPLGSSGIISAVVLSFLECWNMIEQPVTFLESKNLWPLSLFLPEVNENNAGFSLCASFAALLPAVFVFLAGQDYLEQGISASASKE